MFKAIIFDLDGVLIDTERLNVKYKKKRAKELGYSLSKKEISYSLGMGKNEAFEYYFALTKNNQLYTQLSKYRRIKTKKYIDRYGLPVKKHVNQVLSYLKMHNIPITLATSSSKELLDFYFQKSNLKNYFNFIITSDDVNRGKPYPDIFLSACTKLKVNPYEVLVVEDSINGLKAAKVGKFKTAYIKDQWCIKKPQLAYADYILNDIELIKIFF